MIYHHYMITLQVSLGLTDHGAVLISHAYHYRTEISVIIPWMFKSETTWPGICQFGSF